MPLSLKVFLTSLAVFDDLGAIIVIAIFYSGSLHGAALGYAGITLVALILLNRVGVKKLWPYLVLGIMLWFFVEESGIHATISGVLLALAVPLRAKIDSKRFYNMCHCELSTFDQTEISHENMTLTPQQQDSLEAIESAYEAVQNPLVRLEHRLHPISAFFIMPLFAFANAGVQVSGISAPFFIPVSLGILLGLVLGKPLGIAGATYIASRLGWVQKPQILRWHHIIGASILGGVGFTMSIFVTQLAFEETGAIAVSKVFIVACSLFMGIVGLLCLVRAEKTTPRDDAS